MDYLKQCLKNELAQRISKNPRYSLRSFASLLDTNIGTLSAILNGKRKLTPTTAEKFCRRLNYSPARQQEILRKITQSKSSSKSPAPMATELDQEYFRLISEWYHYAILQMINLDDYGTDDQHLRPSWFAKKLGISTAEAKLAIDRLLELGMVTKNKHGFLVRSKDAYTTKDKNVTGPALIAWQKQLREKAIHSLENDPIELRSMNSMTMAIDPEKIEEARVLIQEFQERLAEFLTKDQKKKVYQLTVSLFPLQK